jgi:hypothetical protein
MDTQTQEPETMATKPVAEHQWLQQLIGEWRIESEMMMGPDKPKLKGEGKESTKSLGGLWAYGEGTMTTPDGSSMNYYTALGFDVTFKEYRGSWIADASSHLWRYTGELSADGKKMTLACEGPDMMKDSGTANYRDVIEIIDANNRTLTSYGQDDKGDWHEFMKAHYTRV